jgi:hypothetical protein
VHTMKVLALACRAHVLSDAAVGEPFMYDKTF